MWEYSNWVVEPGHALEIEFAAPLTRARAWFSAQPRIAYRIDFYAAGVDVGHQTVVLESSCGNPSLSESQVVLKPDEGGSFDRLDIVPVGTSKPTGIGGLYIEERAPGRPVNPLSYKATQVPASTGTLHADGARAATVGVDKIGHLMFGPYVRLAPGRYELQIAYRGRLARGVHNGAWDVILWRDKSETRVAGGRMPGTAGTLERLTAPIVIPRTAPDARFEIRVFFDGSGDLTVEGVSLRPTG
jgi:hypothetical protein